MDKEIGSMNGHDMHQIVSGFVPYPQMYGGIGQQAVLGVSAEQQAEQQAELVEYQRKQSHAQVHILAASLAAEARRDGESFSELAEEIGQWLLRGLTNNG